MVAVEAPLRATVAPLATDEGLIVPDMAQVGAIAAVKLTGGAFAPLMVTP